MSHGVRFLLISEMGEEKEVDRVQVLLGLACVERSHSCQLRDIWVGSPAYPGNNMLGIPGIPYPLDEMCNSG